MDGILKLVIEKYIYCCQGDTLTVYLKKKEKILFTCNIRNIEILFFEFEKNPALFFITPSMTNCHTCYSNVSPNYDIKALYDYLVDHQASLCLTSRWKAAWKKHSSVEAEENQKKEEIKQQKKQMKLDKKAAQAVEHIKRIEIEKNQNKFIKAGYKPIREEQYTCVRCNTVWYVNSSDVMLNFGNIFSALNGNVYSANQMKEFNRCPSCRSSASTHKSVQFWVDKKGNVVSLDK